MATPTSVAVHYFDVVKAPKKKLILTEHDGHFALVTHRDEFLAALVKHVRLLGSRVNGTTGYSIVSTVKADDKRT